MTSVADPLFTATPDGEVAPVLVEAFEANEDFTQWTYTIREGMTFHDGTPIDGAAVEFNLESCQYSPLTGAAFLSVESSGPDVTITTNGPAWSCRTVPGASVRVHVLAHLAGDAGGHPAADRTSDLRRGAGGRAGDGEPAEPVGLGAFVFESYTPGNGNSFKLGATRTTGVARTASPVRTCPTSTRSKASSPSTSTAARTPCGPASSTPSTRRTPTPSRSSSRTTFETIATSLFGDTSYIMLNLAEGEADPTGPTPPARC